MKSRTASRALLAALLAAACSSPPVAATPVCPSAAPAPVMSAPSPPALKVNVDDVVKELVAAYNAREPKRSFALMSAAMQNALPLDKEPAWIDGMLSKGPLLETRRVGGDGPTHGIYEVRAERGAFRFEANVDSDGRISGLQVKELVVPPPVPLSTLPLALPFKG